ncbi:MAG: ADP-ribose pyrophosphatase [Deltaproteobacteria bacterium HGW-Deltaproteobacteria-13]|jgi:ADP-ribose pyrophosphatase|nr:MAG: ADP-ribose pyrophosphatase [Deltaproteobacteria bacterium HGW-Deltaproteobacteria-13]
MKKNKSSLMYQCKIFDVWEEEFDLPNGKTARQSWINHNPTVAIVAINSKKELLLIKQYRNAVKKDLLEIPAGSLDGTEESPALCAQRELAEETGFQAGDIIKLFEGYLLPGYCNEYMYFFLARNLTHAPLTPDEDEFIETIPVSFASAQELIKNGQVIDAKTVLGIMLADNFLQQKPA